jgi:DNA-binding transcriptional LysR family regulator
MSRVDFDLNLLVIFEAIYEARNLTRAGEVVGLSQPAMSGALARLRAAVDDELFVRTRDGMIPTAAARAMIGPVRQALKLVDASVNASEAFDPAQAERTFRISMDDLSEARLLPPLLQRLDRVAPRVAIESYRVRRRDVLREFAAGHLDLVIDVPLFSDPNVRHAPFTSDAYVCVVREGHPAVGTELDLEAFLALGHIHISSRPRGSGHVDIALERLGRRRRIALRAEHYLMAPAVVARTDLALTVRRAFAEAMAEQFPVRLLELPFEVQQSEAHLYWHASAEQDAGHAWLRGLLLEIAAQGA